MISAYVLTNTLTDQLRFELISRAHDREGFDCGSEPLSAYLRQIARQHTERGVSRMVVLVESESAEPKPVPGFSKLNLCQLKGEQ